MCILVTLLLLHLSFVKCKFWKALFSSHPTSKFHFIFKLRFLYWYSLFMCMFSLYQISRAWLHLLIIYIRLFAIECFRTFAMLYTTFTKGRCKTYKLNWNPGLAGKAACSQQKTRVTDKLDLSLRNILEKCYIWNLPFYGAETWTLWRVYWKYLELLLKLF